MSRNGDRSLPGDLPLAPEDVEEIVSILSRSDYDSLDIATDRYRLRVSRSGDGWSQEWAAAGGEAAPVEDAPSAAAHVADDGLEAIIAPLPGTFYRAPQPGAPPFVEIGDRVDADTVVAIIETMKLMNPVHAGVDGEIVEIIPDNAEPVEPHAILMKVKPA